LSGRAQFACGGLNKQIQHSQQQPTTTTNNNNQQQQSIQNINN
jgi:hypothetical protein